MRIQTLAAATVVALTITAQDASFAQGIDLTIAPRFQYLYVEVEEDADDQDSWLPSYGLSVFVSAPESSWGGSVTGFFADGSGDFTIGAANGTWDARRIDISAFVEYQPPESAVAILLGVRYFDVDASSSFVGVANSFQETNRQIFAVEGGLRFAGSPWPDSNHIFTGQFTIGVGTGEIEVNSQVNSTYGQVINASETAFAATGEFAMGYSYFVTPKASIGARLRFVGAALFSDIEETPVFAFGPEVNFTYQF